MTPLPYRFTPTNKALLLAVLGIGVGVPLLFQPFVGVPAWLGAGIALVALFGALLVFWRIGALRLRYLILLCVAIGAAVGFGTLLAAP
jgi:hypothetical protein